MSRPLDFLHKNNNEDEWAKRYVANKMGINQMQDGGAVDSNSSNYLNYALETIPPDTMKSIMETGFRTAPKELFDESDAKADSIMKATKEKYKMLMEQYPELYQENEEPVKKGFLQKLLGMQDGGPVYKTSLKQLKDGKWKARAVLEAMTDKGLRYYGGEEIGEEMQNVLDEAESVAKWKMQDTPQDSIASNMVKKYLKQKKGLFDILGMQKGGSVSNDELSQTQLMGEWPNQYWVNKIFDKDGNITDVLGGSGEPESNRELNLDESTVGKGGGYEFNNREYSPVFESAPVDETAHDEINNLILQNEIKDQSGASPLSFVNQDRVDSENQELMDAISSMMMPAAGALSLGKSAFGKFANLPKSKVLNQIPGMKETGKVNWNRFARKGMPKSAKQSFDNIESLSWLEDLIRRNQ